MPEGDSIVRLAQRLRPALGSEPLAVSAPHPRGRLSGVEALDGRRLVEIRTHGKHLLLHFEGGLVLHSHIAMTGAWRTFAPQSVGPGTLRAAWVVLAGGPQVVAQYRGPTLRVLSAARLRSDPRLRSLGPDALDPDCDEQQVLGRMRRGDPGRGLAEVLLDQRIMAGPGLIYASEGPAAAGLHPLSPIGALCDQELSQVISATRELMRDAVQSGRQPRTVQSRKGKPCPRCGGAIQSTSVGDNARRAYWCESCQPLAVSSGADTAGPKVSSASHGPPR